MKDSGQQTDLLLEYCCKYCKDQKESNLVGLDSLTVHGLPRVISSPSGIVKVCWFILFGGSLFLMCYSLRSSLERFYAEPSYVRGRWEVADIIKFPTVTICDMRIRSDVSSSSNHTVSPQDPVVWLDNFLVNSSILRPVNFNKTSSHFPEFCVFGTLQKPCRPEWWKVSPMAPGCVAFNPDGLLTQNNIGQKNGLQLLLYMDSSNLSSNKHSHAPLGEILVSVSHSDVFPDFWSNVFYLELGFSSQIQLVKKRRSLIQGCLKEFPQPHLPGHYDQSICLSSCLIWNTYMECGDILPQYRMFFGYNLLPKLDIVDNTSLCIEKVIKDGSHNNIQSCGCESACNLTSYDQSSFSSSWISNEKVAMLREKLREKLNREVSDNDVRSNFTILNIYYNSLRHYIEQESLAFAWLDLVTDVGGMMGLYIGASVFSILELLFVTLMYVFVNGPRRVIRNIQKKRARKQGVHTIMCYPVEKQRSK